VCLLYDVTDPHGFAKVAAIIESLDTAATSWASHSDRPPQLPHMLVIAAKTDGRHAKQVFQTNILDWLQEHGLEPPLSFSVKASPDDVAVLRSTLWQHAIRPSQGSMQSALEDEAIIVPAALLAVGSLGAILYSVAQVARAVIGGRKGTV